MESNDWMYIFILAFLYAIFLTSLHFMIPLIQAMPLKS